MKTTKRSLAKLVLLASFAAIFLASCTRAPSSKEMLSLWNDDAPAKKALVEYVESVTNKNSADFIPVERRIATFDLDGTLFCETNPTYFDFQLFIHRVLDDPSYTPTEEQKALANDFRATGNVPPLGAEYEKMLASAYAGFTLKEYDSYVKEFMQTAQPGYKNLKRADAFYKPMVEVVNYLVQNGFSVYVSSGTNRLILRALVCDALGLPPKQVIGSDNVLLSTNQNGKDGLEYTFSKGDKVLLGGVNIIKNLQMNKVSTIVKEIGYQPVLAFGNSLTDASMVNYAMYDNEYKSLGFMLCCDDLDREYGNLKKADKMRADCAANGWIPISMKDDWKTIYGEGVEKEN
ncbi:MAG: haloacid dehalogenase-like hydrolase [Treponema sp.]|uniref:haloacid dehalogenase-like hydrolase n=1 Tax=Treponema sp. TaxID=166 RepID=UPI0025EC6726|nr:HAD family hydrolase [Treponema sp.]MBQ8678389.1 haloacid dehalogenase-like hydrolase [Treponema sp.]MBR1404780.1 haloacid dehalogenase-like hydrolase [Treponema sp.]